METNWNQLIDRYLSGELSEEGQVAFEQMRKENSEFEETYQLHCLAIEGVKRNHQRMVIEQLGKSYHRLRKIKLISFIAALILVLGCIGYCIVNRPQNSKASTQSKSVHLTDRKANLSEERGDDIQKSEVGLVPFTTDATNSDDSFSDNAVRMNHISIHNITEKEQSQTQEEKLPTIYFESNKVMGTLSAPKDTQFKILEPSEERTHVPEFKISKVYASFPINKKVRKVQVAGKLGAIDSLNNFVIQPMYDSLELIDWNSMVKGKGESEVQIMFSVKSTSFQYAYFYLVKKEQLYYLFDVHFQLITPNGYDKIETSFVYEQLIKVQKTGNTD